MITEYRRAAIELLKPYFEADTLQLYEALGTPPDPKLGDIAFGCFKYRLSGLNPNETAKELVGSIGKGEIHPFREIRVAGPYVNFFIDEAYLAERTLREVHESGAEYGSSEEGSGKTVVIDYSSPNIAKPLGIGHIRSTMIGAALYRIFRYLGWNCMGINHLGDWGTQFGVMLAALKKTGDERKLDEDSIKYCYRLYVEYNRLMEQDETYRDEARSWFRRLEEGDSEASRLWEKLKSKSLDELKKIYDRLGVEFDAYTGESFYTDKMESAIEHLQNRSLLQESQGAWIVPLDRYDLPPFLVRKSDGTTLYGTRDLAAAEYRAQEYKFNLALYVTGTPQSLHFQQLFKVCELLGYPWAENMHHVSFGHIIGMSTRKGTVVFLKDVINEAVKKAREKIVSGLHAGRFSDDSEIDAVSEAVGIGALIFNDLKNKRVRDITFDYDQMLSFEGETGPYLQYSHARICSILRKAEDVPEVSALVPDQFADPEVKRLLMAAAAFPETVQQAANEFEPSVLSNYLLDLASKFNSFYHTHRVLQSEEPVRSNRLLLIQSVRQILKNGLNLLGIKALEKM